MKKHIKERIVVLKRLSFMFLFLTVSFLLFSTSVVNPGTEAKNVAVDCNGHKGNISVKTGAHITEGRGERLAHYRNAISVEYAGTQSANCQWLQFASIQVIVYRKLPNGVVGPPSPNSKTGSVNTTGGTLDLTTDPDSPNFGVDSGTENDPYYEARFSNVRDANSTTIFDEPGTGINEIAGAEKADPNVTRIESIWRFETFLVCNNKICAKVAWTWTSSWTPGPNGGTQTGPTPEVKDPEVPGDLNKKQQDAFKARYPHHTVPTR